MNIILVKKLILVKFIKVKCLNNEIFEFYKIIESSLIFSTRGERGKNDVTTLIKVIGDVIFSGIKKIYIFITLLGNNNHYKGSFC